MPRIGPRPLILAGAAELIVNSLEHLAPGLGAMLTLAIAEFARRTRDM